MESKICPIMSGRHLEERYDRMYPRLVLCQKEKCALWVIRKDGDFCGLIRD